MVSPEPFSPEESRVLIAKAQTELDALPKRHHAYVELQEQVQKTGTGEVVGS